MIDSEVLNQWLPWLAFLTGLAGSLHCIGMCGPLSMAFLGKGKAGQAKIWLYHAGRLWVYVMLGMLAGWLSAGFYFIGLQRLVAVGSGMVVLFALFNNFHFKMPWPEKLKQKLLTLFHKTHSGKGSDKWLWLGMINGIIPCGLVYIALAASITSGSLFTGGLYMLFFGLGTFPLLLLNLLPRMFSFEVKPFWQRRVIPALSLVAAIIFFLRGMPNLSANISKDTKSACHTPVTLKRDKGHDIPCSPELLNPKK
jgi:sulfite exporter TauE/SafE